MDEPGALVVDVNSNSQDLTELWFNITTMAVPSWHRVALIRLMSSVKGIGHIFNQNIQIKCRCQIRAIGVLRGLLLSISRRQVIDFCEIESVDCVSDSKLICGNVSNLQVIHSVQQSGTACLNHFNHIPL